MNVKAQAAVSPAQSDPNSLFHRIWLSAGMAIGLIATVAGQAFSDTGFSDWCSRRQAECLVPSTALAAPKGCAFRYSQHEIEQPHAACRTFVEKYRILADRAITAKRDHLLVATAK